MASDAAPDDSSPLPSRKGAALQHATWRSRALLSRGLDAIERFLDESGFDRAPWLAVAFGAGIAGWFILPGPVHWLALVAAGTVTALAAAFILNRDARFVHTRQALIWAALALTAGCLAVWTKSAMVGQPAIDRPMVGEVVGRVLERHPQPAQDRVRLVLAARLPDTGQAVKLRVNLPQTRDDPRIAPGALIRVRARLMPPAPPMLPGSYDFARTAWFAGLAATGTATGPAIVIEPAPGGGSIAGLQARLSQHVRERLDGPAGAIAATLASGDRGALGEEDTQAMRDSGLAHLLAISGLHVSALIAVTYLVAIRLLALSPWLALRLRLPVLAAGAAALAGIGYTLLTGAQVPTVRACVGALLVLAAVAMGREALSLRMLALAAFVVLLIWPESLVGPSFQMSFAAVAALIAFGTSERVRRFTAPRDERAGTRLMRQIAMIFITSLLIEIVLMPIAFHHFHRAGAYGAVANVIAIPLTTLVIMPLIAGALLLDLAGAGGILWWLAGKAIDLILLVAQWISAQPGAVTTMPAMTGTHFVLFVAGGLWLGLWSGRVRLLGLVPAAFGALGLFLLRPPDILVSGDGRHVGITGTDGGELVVLRDTRSGFVRDNLAEMAGMAGNPRVLADWDGARCTAQFCVVTIARGMREWHVLIARNRDRVPERALAAACERADIVIADRGLPRSCRPRWLKADRRMLEKTGGLAIDLDAQAVTTVAQGQGEHGWWRGR